MNKWQRMIDVKLERIVEFLGEHPRQTIDEIVEALDIPKTTLYSDLRRLRGEFPGDSRPRRVRISAWRPIVGQGKGGAPAPLYSLGTFPDARRPKRVSRTVYGRRHREKYGTLLALRKRKKRGALSVWYALEQVAA